MKFETPIVEVKKFDVQDVLTASGDPVETTELMKVYIDPCI